MSGAEREWWGLGGWVAIFALAAWVRWLEPLLLGVAGVSIVLSLLPSRARSGFGGLASVSLIVAVLAGFIGDRGLQRLSTDWESLRAEEEEEVQAALSRALDRLIQDGDRAVERLVSDWDAAARGQGGPVELTAIRRQGGLDAIAVFDPVGELIAWDGVHHGPLPHEIRTGDERYVYRERPLFGYLYFTARLADGSTAVVARLLREDLPPTLDGGDGGFTGQLERETAATLRVSRAERLAGEGIWDLRWRGETLFSVELIPPGQAEARSALLARWGGAVAIFLILAWILMARGGSVTRGRRLSAALALPAIVLILPVGSLLDTPGLFSAARFLSPGPLEVTLGSLLILGAVGSVLVGFLSPPSAGPWKAAASSLAAVGGMAGVVWFMREGASVELLAGDEWEWVAYAGAMGLFASLVVGLGMRPFREGRGRPEFLVLAGLSAVALSLLLVLQVERGPQVPVVASGLFIVPLALASLGLSSDRGLAATGGRWLLAVVVGMTLALPSAFGDRVEARMASAEREVERLGTQVDPYLEFLLHRVSEEAAQLRAAGRTPVEVLYGAWVSSGFAWEGYPIWLTHMGAEVEQLEELRVGVGSDRPGVPQELVEEAVESGTAAIRRFDLADAHYMAVVPLPEGEWVTAIVPPRRTLSSASPLGPFLGPESQGRERLVLIPLLPGEAPGHSDEIRWISTDEGWQAELYLTYPDQTYHAHYIVELPGVLLLLARGTLLTLFALLLALSLWYGGRWVGGRVQVDWSRWPHLVYSFRTRVTVALFVFFLVPTLIVGTTTYRTLHGASIRTAEVLAERALEDAAGRFIDLQADLEDLARSTGSDLILFDRGEIVRASTPALVELGLYEGWLPRPVHRVMEEGEELMTTVPASLGGWDHVMAYRRVAGQQVLATPAPVEVGATALRQREITDLLGFVLVVGAGLSVLLSLVVGRALSRPIQTLQVASERVGAGNLEVHIPENRRDEFGSVFGAFNRMVRRLRIARGDLVRSTERTRAIVEEVATGLVAMDPEGRVVLANPRAEELLGVPLRAGERLPGSADGAERGLGTFLRWMEAYLKGDREEDGMELQSGARRVRVRARRIARRSPKGGVVVSLEDVTDELRSERILAWGEMARQVAHQVKNPLTPIKLGVQHIQRAWRDQRPDFTEILERNAAAILAEIDRLATVATGFSRFSAPGATADLPLEPVDVEKVVQEVLTLYSAGSGGVDFSFRPNGTVGAVRAREPELREVLVNLLENARAAVGDRGAVEVRATRSTEVTELEVRDDGQGISPESLPHIFEPRFSTRSSGSGLGLAIVQRLVESWGGVARVESVEGRGTTVRIHLIPWEADPAGGGEEPGNG